VAKLPLKRGFLGSKRGYSGAKKYELAANLERKNGAKCRFFSQKQTKRTTRKARNRGDLPTLWPIFSLEWSEN